MQIEACPVDLQRRELVIEQSPGLGGVADNVDAAFSRLIGNARDLIKVSGLFFETAVLRDK